MKLAYVFPGQGSQRVGMGLDLYASSPRAKAVFDEADSVLGTSLSRLCFEGPEDVLCQTVNAQPAILTTSIAYLRSSRGLESGDYSRPAFVAGHSLGEYTALIAAGSLDFAQALKLARERGRLMQEAGERAPGGMLAILGLDEETVREVCLQGGVEIANINSPGQVVVSGARGLLPAVAELAKARGARRAIPLDVSGAFHSALMQPASEGTARAISQVELRDPVIPIIGNTTALPLVTAEEVRRELCGQVCSCVQWQRSVEYMVGAGVTTFIEIGLGQTLAGLIKRISPTVQVLTVKDVS